MHSGNSSSFLLIPILKYNGITGTTDQHKTNILANHFATNDASNCPQEFTANQYRTLHIYIELSVKHTPETSD